MHIALNVTIRRFGHDPSSVMIDKFAFSGTIFILSSKNHFNRDSVTFSGLRVAFNLHVEILRNRSLNFTTILLFQSGPIFFQMLLPIEMKTLLSHAKFISLSFELRFGILFVVVMKRMKKAWANYGFCTHYFGSARRSPIPLFNIFAALCCLCIQYFRFISIYILRCVIGMTRNLLSSRCFPSQHCKQHNYETASLPRKITLPAFPPKSEMGTNGIISFFCNMGAGVHPFLSKVQLPRE